MASRRQLMRETHDAQAQAEQNTAKRIDMTSNSINVVPEKGAKNNFRLREVISGNWTAV
jgi:hypothetical protein